MTNRGCIEIKKGITRGRFHSRVLTVLLISTISMSNVRAGNYVKVATIGTLPAKTTANISQETVTGVIGFWKSQLQQVIYDQPDLIVLPELSDLPVGLSVKEKNEYIRVRKNQVLEYFESAAKAQHCYIAFGMIRQDSAGNLWNSLILLGRKGEMVGIYDKNFPTIDEMEMGIHAGTKTALFQCDFGRVGMAICFDLNFDELRERYAQLKPDIILFASAYHGGFVQSTWAYSCRSFFVGAIGAENCRSEIRNPLGQVISSSTNYFDFTVASINLDSRLAHLDFNWERLKALKEKYGNAVTINDPGNIGVVLISSEDKNVKVDQMIREFDIELLDHYLNRAREYRLSHGNITR